MVVGIWKCILTILFEARKDSEVYRALCLFQIFQFHLWAHDLRPTLVHCPSPPSHVLPPIFIAHETRPNHYKLYINPILYIFNYSSFLNLSHIHRSLLISTTFIACAWTFLLSQPIIGHKNFLWAFGMCLSRRHPDSNLPLHPAYSNSNWKSWVPILVVVVVATMVVVVTVGIYNVRQSLENKPQYVLHYDFIFSKIVQLKIKFLRCQIIIASHY